MSSGNAWHSFPVVANREDVAVRQVSASDLQPGTNGVLPAVFRRDDDGVSRVTGDDEQSPGLPVVTAAMFPISSRRIVSFANVPKSVPKPNENGPRSDLRGPFLLVAGTGFEPATSGL
jgi:hypothetical protein